MQYLIRTYFPLTIGYLKTYNSNNYFSDFTIAVIIDSQYILTFKSINSIIYAIFECVWIILFKMELQSSFSGLLPLFVL